MTKPVTRYTQPCFETLPGLEFKVTEVELFEDPQGKWVRYEDYAKLKHAYEAELLANRPKGDVVRSAAEPGARHMTAAERDAMNRAAEASMLPECTCALDEIENCTKRCQGDVL